MIAAKTARLLQTQDHGVGHGWLGSTACEHVVRDPRDRLAERYGEWLEGKECRDAYAADEPYFRQPLSGSRVGYGGYGRTMTGVISNADLAANKAGLQMYKDLHDGRFKSVGDYMTSDLCEETNLNGYTSEMEAIVRMNGRR